MYFCYKFLTRFRVHLFCSVCTLQISAYFITFLLLQLQIFQLLIKLSPRVTFSVFIIVGENWAEIRKKSSFLGNSSVTDAPILYWIMHPTTQLGALSKREVIHFLANCAESYIIFQLYGYQVLPVGAFLEGVNGNNQIKGISFG